MEIKRLKKELKQHQSKLDTIDSAVIPKEKLWKVINEVLEMSKDDDQEAKFIKRTRLSNFIKGKVTKISFQSSMEKTGRRITIELHNGQQLLIKGYATQSRGLVYLVHKVKHGKNCTVTVTRRDVKEIMTTTVEDVPCNYKGIYPAGYNPTVEVLADEEVEKWRDGTYSE